MGVAGVYYCGGGCELMELSLVFSGCGSGSGSGPGSDFLGLGWARLC